MFHRGVSIWEILDVPPVLPVPQRVFLAGRFAMFHQFHRGVSIWKILDDPPVPPVPQGYF